MKTLYIKDLEKGLIIDGEVFLILSCEKCEDKNGKSYYKISLGDKTGKLDGKVWSDSLAKIDEKILKAGNLLKISGKVDEYKGVFQVNILSAERIQEDKLEDFLESSSFDAEEMFSEILTEIENLNDSKLKALLNKIFSDAEVKRKFMYWPAATAVHHNFRSGLLQHVLEMLTISKSLVRFYPDINYDILTAGILLHDIGKIYELDRSDLAVPYTKEGTLMGHINISLRIFESFGGKDLDENTYLHIAHLILSHHGSYAFGSPVLPSTVEAIILTYIDNLSAKARTADSVRSRIPEGEEFSQRIIWLDNSKIWKGGNSQLSVDIHEETTDIKDIPEQLEF